MSYLTQFNVLLALTILSLHVIAATTRKENNTYIILSPKEFRPGTTLTIKVSILKSASPVLVTASITSKTKTIAQNNGSFSAGQSDLDLVIPYNQAVNTERYMLQVNGSGGLDFKEQSYIGFRDKGFSLQIQTDKGIYKPGQTVRMRIFGLLPNLRAYMGKMTVDILDPNSNKMSHWKDLQNASGVIKKDFPLSVQPLMGIWKIQVNAQGQKYEQQFEVKEYVLPKFKVEVSLPPFMTKTTLKARNLVGSIIAKYTYGKGVLGTGEVSIYFRSYYWRNHQEPKKITLSKIPVKGTGSFEFPASQIEQLYKDSFSHRQGKDDLYNPYSWAQAAELVVNATLKENLSTKSASGYSEIKFYMSDIKLDFPSFNPKTFKPDLAFDIVLKLSQPDDSPVDPRRLQRMKISVTKSYDYVESKVKDMYTPGPEGIIVIRTAMPNSTSSFSIKAQYIDESGHTVSKSFHANKAVSPSSSYIQLQTSTPSVKAGEAILISLRSSFPMSIIYWLVMARGNIRLSGRQDIAANANTTSFSFPSTPIMAPSAQVLAYSIRKGGEVIVDSLTVTISEPFENKVTLRFDRNVSRPGDQVNLVAKATPGSSVAFRVIDESVLLMKKDNDVTCNKIMSDLQEYSMGSSYPWWMWNWFTPRRRRRSIMPFPVPGQDAKSVFENSGLIVMSNCLIYSRPYYPIMYAAVPEAAGAAGGDRVVQKNDGSGRSQPLAEVKRVRSLFPETWIWVDEVASSSGEVELSRSVPDTITSWVGSAFAISPSTGFGVACDRAKHRVFQSFFVSLDLPYSVIRGEEVAIKAHVFNYLPDPQEVTVTLKDWEIINEIKAKNDSKAKDVSYKLIVPANEGKSVAFPIRPKTLGVNPIVVQAQSYMAADAVRRNLIVKAEGFPQSYSYTVLIDLNTTSSFTKELKLATPEIVEGSAHAKVSVLGDILGSSFSNLDNLLRMPYGCGEQNMVNFAPNTFILKYLTAVKQLTPAIQNKAETYMAKGYQRQQTYLHKDYSYSAFGNRDPAGSMWLTAFVVKSFAQARQYTNIDEDLLDKSLLWIINNQNDEGQFPVMGKVHSSYLKGGLKGSVALTAFVVIALAEAKSGNKQVQDAMARGVRYLERSLPSVTAAGDVYSLAICTYAMALTKSSSEAAARSALMGRHKAKDGTMYWTDKEEDEKEEKNPYRPYYRPRSADVEITAYALLAMKQRGDIQAGLPVVRWMSQQRNSLGGYSSTQDTVLGIQAMSEFAALIYSSRMDYTVKLSNTEDKAFSKTFSVNTQNAMVLQQVDIPKVLGSLRLEATGHGIGILQVGITYNLAKLPAESKFKFVVEVLSQSRYELLTKSCATWKGDGSSSGMSVMAIDSFSGFVPDKDSLDKLLNDERLPALKRVDSENQQTVIYFDEIFKEKSTCVNILYVRAYPTGTIQPAGAVVYDYYSPEYRAEALYKSKSDESVCDVCPMCMSCPVIPPTEGKLSSAGHPAAGTWLVMVAAVGLALVLHQ